MKSTSGCLFSTRLKVHWVWVFHSEPANFIKIFALFVSPDDSGSRGGVGAASGVSDQAPELAGKLGNHRRTVTRTVARQRGGRGREGDQQPHKQTASSLVVCPENWLWQSGDVSVCTRCDSGGGSFLRAPPHSLGLAASHVLTRCCRPFSHICVRRNIRPRSTRPKMLWGQKWQEKWAAAQFQVWRRGTRSCSSDQAGPPVAVN